MGADAEVVKVCDSSATLHLEVALANTPRNSEKNFDHVFQQRTWVDMSNGTFRRVLFCGNFERWLMNVAKSHSIQFNNF